VPVAKCPRHGSTSFYPLCVHAVAAMNALQPIVVYLQVDDVHEEYGLCAACMQRRPIPNVLDELVWVCQECADDWVRATGSDLHERLGRLRRFEADADEFP
jgi:hypothetical protein